KLSGATENIEKQISRYSLENKTRYLCTLLFDELSYVLTEKLDAKTPVTVRVGKSLRDVSVRLSLHADRNIMEDEKVQSDDDSEIEQIIRNTVLESNADKIRTKYDSKKQKLIITISVALKPKRDYEQELEDFYSFRKGKSPSASATMFFFVKQRFLKFLLAFIIKVIRSAPMVVIPVISANIIDIVSDGMMAQKLLYFFLNVGIGIFSLLLNILFSFLDSRFFKKLCFSIGEDLRNVMVRKLQILSITYHKENQTGAITNKMLNNVESIENAFGILGTQITIILTYVAAALVITMIEAPVMALFYVLFIPMAIFLAAVFRKPISSKNKELRKSMEGANAAVTEMLGMVETTRAHGLQKDEISRMSHYMENIRDAGTKLEEVNQFFGAVSWAILQFFQILALAFSAYIASKGMISIGMIALFQAYFTQTVTRISTFINILPQCTKGFDACLSIAEVLCADSDEHMGTKSPETFKGDITFKDVDFRYKKDDPKILDKFSLHIPSGQSVALVGGSGSGKSTLINLIIGFNMPDSGSVTIDGISTKDMNLTRLRKHLAVVTQNTVLSTGTLYQNLVYGSPYVTRAKVESTVREVGLGELIDSLPDGLDTFVTESGSNLSGGQKQRISIARALLRDPAIMILDEPTSALDSENELRIKEILRKIQGRCTIIMIAHRLTMVEHFDNIIVLEKGFIAEQGTYTQLMAKEGGAFRKLNLQTSDV
ncbi:MAG: ABC transporter ATP-binding protein, partial [Spirochaetales bacterium]|nr:ABC transporter ATP-binding protein [Spirochaetales bacterium]